VKIVYKEWTRIPWDGNTALNFECWRKSFRGGRVSVGIGDEFQTVVFSYGPNSQSSYSSTRWRLNGAHLSESEAMARVDATDGRSL
jgi:hypothetical protein